LAVVKRLWEAGQSKHPDASFEGHFGPSSLGYEEKRRYDEQLKEMSPYTWRLLPRFLPMALTLMSVKHQRPDVLSWCLSQGASPYPRIPSHDSFGLDTTHETTHVSLRGAITQQALEAINEGVMANGFKYQDSERHVIFKKTVLGCNIMLTQVAAHLPGPQATPLLGLEEPLGKFINFANRHRYLRDFSGMFEAVEKSQTNLLEVAEKTGIRLLFESLNKETPEWLFTSLDGGPSLKGLKVLRDAIVSGLEGVEYEFKKAVGNRSNELIVAAFEIALAGLEESVLKHVFYSPDESGKSFFELENKKSAGAEWVPKLESWVQQKILAKKHSKITQDAPSNKTLKSAL
jgi:hypothetical protein